MPEEHVLHFELSASGAGHVVALTIDGEAVGTAPFDDAWKNAGETGEALRAIEEGTGDVGDLETVGSQLWNGLIAADVPGPIRTRVVALRKRQINEDLRLTLRIEAPPGLDLLPWEALYDPRRTAFVASDPQCAVVRHPYTKDLDVPDAACRTTEKLRVLVVIPAGSGLRVADEWGQLRSSFRQHAALLEGGEPALVEGRVTFQRLKDELARAPWDIVHFIGHGWVDDRNRVRIRLNKDDGSEDGQPAEAFATLFQRRGVQLVFMNCCHGAVASTKDAFAGLAPALLARGVPAVFAMRYAIADDAAIKLSAELYRALLSGPHRGRIDVAAQAARETLMGLIGSESRGARVLATPVLFLSPGSPRLFELPVASSPEDEVIGTPEVPAPSLPDEARARLAELASVVAASRAVLVLGPALTSPPRDDAALAALTLRGLIEHLVAKGDYDRREIEDAEKAGEWLDPMLLQRVCQHFEAAHQRRGPLTEALIAAHAEIAEPPDIFTRIAGWPFAGAVCAHFDGMLERALRRRGRKVRPAYGVNQAVGGEREQPIVLHLRGSVEAPTSLVLTEREHDELWDALPEMPAESRTLVTGAIDRSLVFLGVSPRDLWVRRFARHLLPTKYKDAGRVYFVWPDATDADKAVWKPFDPVWIDVRPAAAVAEVTRLLASPAAPKNKGAK